MALQDAIQRAGRVEYIEPNSLFIQSPGDKIQNGIPQPYEDYCFSVNLRIVNGNRYDCGMPGSGEDLANNILEYSSDHGTLSFIDGTSNNGQSYLTTNFTDISMNNPETNTKECLGIKTINIKYSSWFAPTVDIVFLDVMGASLMQPSEYEYYNNGGRSVGLNNTSVSTSKFFKAFFSFPYPLFKLSVKGYYGKETTYDLALEKCNVNFNASIGCFEVSASFIGYLYGIYTDFPFSLAYIAPYVDLYGKNAWQEKKNRGDFVYLTNDKNGEGLPMHTFKELTVAVNDIEKNFDKKLDTTLEGKKRKEAKVLIEYLEKQIIPNFPLSTSNGSWLLWSKTNTSEEPQGYAYILTNVNVPNPNEVNRMLFSDFMKFGKYIEEYNVYAKTKSEHHKDSAVGTKSPFEDIYQEAKNLVNPSAGEDIANSAYIAAKFTDANISDIFSGKIVSLVFNEDVSDPNNPKLNYVESSSDFGSADPSLYTDLVNEIIRKYNDNDYNSAIVKGTSIHDYVIKAFYFDNINYKKGLVKRLDALKSEVNELENELASLREKSLEEMLKFDPTIQNFYNLAFAHVDTFMSIFYNTLNNIHQSIISSTDDTRKKDNLCGGNIHVDVNENTLRSKEANGGKLPPFPMFYKEVTVKESGDKKNVAIWPGSLNNGEMLDEVKLINALLNATSLSKKSYPTVTPKNNTVLKDGDIVPTNYYDLIVGKGNPYLDVLNQKSVNDNSIMDELFKVFVLRCFYALQTGDSAEPQSITSTSENPETMTRSTATIMAERAKLVGELEVENVVRAFQMIGMAPTENFIQKILGLPKDGSKLIDQYLKGEKPMFVKSSNESITYSWIENGTSSGEKLYPVSMFNMSKLDMYSNTSNVSDDLDKFIKISQTDGTINTENSCRLFLGGNKVEDTLTKYASGEFTRAANLFKNFKKLPDQISGITFKNKTYSINDRDNNGDLFSDTFTMSDLWKRKNSLTYLVPLPSYRVTEAGITSTFMDPLYYAQNDILARAYLFLFGIPYGKDKKYFLPSKPENGDYPTLLLLREGAVYWRNSLANDPIKYNYVLNGVQVNEISDIEANDPCFGKVLYNNWKTNNLKNYSVSRRNLLRRYFVKWVTGNDPDSGSNVDVPTPKLPFSKIESMLALFGWYESATLTGTMSLPRFLGDMPNGIDYAMSYPTVFSYANAGTSLNDIYRKTYVTINNETQETLGKLNGRIRTEVSIDTNILLSEYSTAPKEIKEFARNLSNLFLSFDTVIDYGTIERADTSLGVLKDSMIQGLSAFIEGLRVANKVTIEDYKKRKGGSANGEPVEVLTEAELIADNDVRLSIYICLKNLYDKWLCSRRRESFMFSAKPGGLVNNGIHSDFERFFFVDEFYHDIGMTTRPGIKNLLKQVNAVAAFTNDSDEFDLQSRTLFKTLSIMAQEANCALLPLPTMLGLGKIGTPGDKRHRIEDVFKAYPYNEAVKTDDIETSFVVLYSGEKSGKLANDSSDGKNGYTDDGFDIADTWGRVTPITSMCDSLDDGYIIPAFGVTFAKQNQSFFSDVSLSMQDHQITEYAIRNMLYLANGANLGPRGSNLIGQDLYAVYSNYSYSCSVTMLGDSQITPLMYFQLNNIPMWKGAYLIIEVSHSIDVSGMKTTFRGVRQSKYSPPNKNDKIVTAADDSEGLTPESQAVETIGQGGELVTNTPARVLDTIDANSVQLVVFELTRLNYAEETNIIRGNLSARIRFTDDSDVLEKERVIDISSTVEPAKGPLEQFDKLTEEQRNEIFTLPAGKYSLVMLANAGRGEEYRDANESFFKPMPSHIMVSDGGLGLKRSEMITGETFGNISSNDYYKTEKVKEISIGGLAPIMLYGHQQPTKDGQFSGSESRASYRELYDFLSRIILTGKPKPLSLLVKNGPDFKP